MQKLIDGHYRYFKGSDGRLHAAHNSDTETMDRYEKKGYVEWKYVKKMLKNNQWTSELVPVKVEKKNNAHKGNRSD